MSGFISGNAKGSLAWAFDNFNKPSFFGDGKLGIGRNYAQLNITGEVEGSPQSSSGSDYKLYPLKNAFFSVPWNVGKGSPYRAFDLRFGVVDPYRDFSGRLPKSESDNLLHDRDSSPFGEKRALNHESGGSELGGSLSLNFSDTFQVYGGLTTANPTTDGLLTWKRQEDDSSFTGNPTSLNGHYGTVGLHLGKEDELLVNASFSSRRDEGEKPVRNVNLAVGKSGSPASWAFELSRTWGKEYGETKYGLINTKPQGADTFLHGALGLSFGKYFSLPLDATLSIYPTETEMDSTSVSKTGFNQVNLTDPEWERTSNDIFTANVAPRVDFAKKHLFVSANLGVSISESKTLPEFGLKLGGSL